MSYGQLNVPAFTPEDQGEIQKNYFSMVDDSMDGAIKATTAINEANQTQYTNALNQVFGSSFSDTWQSGLTTLKARAEGKFTDAEKNMFDTMYAAKAQNLGLGGSGASINVSMQGFGTRMLAAQSEAIQAIPAFATAARNNLMVTPTRVESMFIPISQYASQRHADNISQWRQQYAQEQSRHQAEMNAEALRRQEAQANRARAESIRSQAVATRNSVNMQNAANYRAGVNSGYTGSMRGTLRQKYQGPRVTSNA